MNYFSKRTAYTIPFFLSLCVLLSHACQILAQESKEDPSRSQSKPYATLKTRWTDKVDLDAPWPEYPRPQMVRKNWTNLNGRWDFAITELDAKQPTKWEGKIVVPFAIESRLSQVQRFVSEKQALWYHQTLKVSKPTNSNRVILHFAAVDWDATVWVNNTKVGSHQGAYDPFALDITDALGNSSNADLVVRVWDPTDTMSQPRGKQVKRPEGIWYTSVTGIWQTVWVEEVPANHIKKLSLSTDVASSKIKVASTLAKQDGSAIQARVTGRRLREKVETIQSDFVSAGGSDSTVVTLPVKDVKLWTPDSPWLYDIEVRLVDRTGVVIDSVTTYQGMRTITVGKAEDGFLRMLLNGKPLFQYGPLDQGWWPDGLHTPPTQKAMEYDVDVTKELGFNMARKHIKVEPDRWYAYCDSVGLLVWQDFPSGAVAQSGQFVQPDWKEDGLWKDQEATQFLTELKAMMDHLSNHPCIVCWVPFNEGWGQHNTNAILKQVKEWDSTRLVNGPSGWTDRGYGDMKDMHSYPGPNMFPAMDDRISVLGEFGGLGLPIDGHTWLDKNNWGYQSFPTKESLQMGYDRLLYQVPGLIAKGLSAAVYTQTTDVEVEVNGLMTYDREIIKFDPARMKKIHARLHQKPAELKVLVPTSRPDGQVWSYTFSKPQDDWMKPSFDGSKWMQGKGGFGSKGTPGAAIGTEWTGSEIWLRREFKLETIPETGEICLDVHFDEDALVSINGTEPTKLPGYTVDYQVIPLSKSQRDSLVVGKNTFAVYCRNQGGGQYIDVGLMHLQD